MEPNDRFHTIISSDPIRYSFHPSHETVITFFIISRASGVFDIIHILKTYDGDQCVSRKVQEKPGIKAARIFSEIAAIKELFSTRISNATGMVISWNTLSLYDVPTIDEQCRMIKAWGRVGVSAARDIPPTGSN
jgi:hypothetical protein